MSSSSSSSSKFSRTIITFFFISATLTLFHLPISTSTTAFYTCSQTEYPTTSPYAANLKILLSSLANNTGITGFFNATVGRQTDTVYGFALCRGDLSSAECQPCLDDAVKDAVAQCPSKRSGALWYDRCRLRYSDEPFFSTLTPDVPNPYYSSFNKVPDSVLFSTRIETLLKGLQKKAAYGENSNNFAAGSINYTEGKSLYGLLQCTRDLSSDACAKCLDDPIQMIVCCQFSVDATFQGGSCYLRYSMDMFYSASMTPSQSSIDEVTTTVPPTSSGKKRHSTACIVIITVGVALAAIFLAIFLTVRTRRRPKHLSLAKSLQLQEGGGLQFHRLVSKKASFLHNQRSPETPLGEAQKLDLQTLRMATEDFSDSKKLGRGEYGSVYKGDIHGREFVVKRVTGIPKVGSEELRKELRSIKQIQNSNLVRLLGFHIEEVEKLFVYEYLPNTSLDRILFDPKKRVLLDWKRRYKIIEGIGRGLHHLHEESGLNIIHQNLKASNILLEKNMNPKISDYFLAKLFTGSQNNGSTRRTAASQGYTDNAGHGSASAKSDVFSYGVLVLEIVTGQRNRDFLGSENTTNLLSYVWQYWKDEKALQVLDWSLGELYKGHEVLRCIHIGLLCVQDDPEKRPNMSTVVHMLNSYSFTLPSPSVPAVTRVQRAAPNSNQSLRNGNSGNFDWKVLNQNLSQLSPRSPSDWSDIALDSNGRGRR